MSKSTVCLTFDFDAFSLWLMRGVVTPGTLSRGEFAATAVRRLLNLLQDRNIRSTWFIPGHTVVTFPDLCRAIHDSGHEVGVHGFAHERASTLTLEGQRDALLRGRSAIADCIGKLPAGNRMPGFDVTHHTIALLEEMGFVYDSSLMATDYQPYWARTGDAVSKDTPYQFGRETKVLELPVSWSLDDYMYFEFYRDDTSVMPGLRDPDQVFGSFFADIQYMTRDFDSGVCVITFHPEVIGRGHRLLGLERFLDRLSILDVRYARLEEIAIEAATGINFGVYRPSSVSKNSSR